MVTDDDGHVVELVEKAKEPPSSLVTTGVYALPRSTFDACREITPSDRGEYELVDAVDRLRRQGATVRAVEFDGWRVNVNTVSDLETTEQKLPD